jgi:hypothetical protein
MSPNAGLSLIAGFVLLGVAGGAAWGMSTLLTAMFSAMGKTAFGAFIAAGPVVFLAYLIGYGYLANKQTTK